MYIQVKNVKPHKRIYFFKKSKVILSVFLPRSNHFSSFFYIFPEIAYITIKVCKNTYIFLNTDETISYTVLSSAFLFKKSLAYFPYYIYKSISYEFHIIHSTLFREFSVTSRVSICKDKLCKIMATYLICSDNSILR